MFDFSPPPPLWTPPKPAIIRAGKLEKPKALDLAMLPGMIPVPVSPPPAVVNITNTDSEYITTTLTTYTFTSSFGAAAADRHLVVGVNALSSSTASRTVVSVDIAGVTATEVVFVQVAGAGNDEIHAMWIGAVPTGTSGTVTIVFSGSCVGCTCSLWRMTGANITATDTTTDATITANALAGSLVIPTNGGGIGIVHSLNGTANRTFTWTDLTEQFDINGETSVVFSDVSGALSLTAGSLTRTATASGTISQGGLVLAAWGP